MILSLKLLLVSFAAFLVFMHASGAETSVPAIHADSLPEGIPWDLEKLGEAPDFEWGEGDQVRELHYKGEVYEGKRTRVFARYATPGSLAGDASLDKNLPGIVLIHGGGGKAYEEWVRLWASRGFAAISMDLAGKGPDKKPLPDGGPGQTEKFKFRTEPPLTDVWTYQAAAAVIRAHSLLLSFPEVDQHRTAITGISWGGYLTCIVAGLDNRFQAAVPVYGCGFLHENSYWLPEFAKMSAEDRRQWIELWDPSNYVGHAKMPMMFVTGGKDFAYPPDSHAKTYALVKSPKNLHFVPHLPHGHVFDKPLVLEAFIRQHLTGGDELAKISEPMTEGGKIYSEVRISGDPKKTTLHYTADIIPGDSKARRWAKKPAEFEDGKIIADVPPKNATAWFFTLVDENGYTVSSPLSFQK